MKILYHPQISMRSYDGKGWLLDSDAQLTKMRAYVENLPDDWEHHWLLPRNTLLPDTLGAFFNTANARPWALTWPENVLEARFDFHVQECVILLTMIRPDVLLLEVPEHARAWRIAMRSAGYSCPIISMVEHVDIYKETQVDVPFMLRQLDGALASDLLAFPLEGMQREWFKAVGHISPEDVHPKNSTVWNAIFSPKEVVDAGSAVPSVREAGDPYTIFFISRLSDNQRTHYVDFMEALELLAEQGVKKDQLRVWFANPNDAGDWLELAELPFFQENPFGNRRLTRDEYFALLWASDMVPILYPNAYIYSVGFCEAVTAGAQILTQKPVASARKASPFLELEQVAAGSIAAEIQFQLSAFARKQLPRNGPGEDYRLNWLQGDRGIERNIKAVQDDIEKVVTQWANTTTQ